MCEILLYIARVACFWCEYIMLIKIQKLSKEQIKQSDSWMALQVKGGSSWWINVLFQWRNSNKFREIGLITQWKAHFLLHLAVNT